MKVPIQDMLFAHIGHKSIGGANCYPAHFEWSAVTSSTPARFYDDLCMRHAHYFPHPRVGWLVEAPPYAQCHYDWAVEHEDEFDCILTHCLDYAERGEPWRWYPRGGSHVCDAMWGVKLKIRMASLLASNKVSTEGHRLRYAIRDMYSDRIDIHGSIIGNRIGKCVGIGPYRFSIIVAAERNRGCFCDHIIDAFALGTVPIYWGCPNIGDYFNADGIIQFDDVDELAVILDGLSAVEYDRRKDAIAENYELAQQYRVPEDWIFAHYPDLFEGL